MDVLIGLDMEPDWFSGFKAAAANQDQAEARLQFHHFQAACFVLLD